MNLDRPLQQLSAISVAGCLKLKVQVRDHVNMSLVVKENNAGISTIICIYCIYTHTHTLQLLLGLLFYAFAFILKSWSQICDVDGGSYSRDRHLTVP